MARCNLTHRATCTPHPRFGLSARVASSLLPRLVQRSFACSLPTICLFRHIRLVLLGHVRHHGRSRHIYTAAGQVRCRVAVRGIHLRSASCSLLRRSCFRQTMETPKISYCVRSFTPSNATLCFLRTLQPYYATRRRKIQELGGPHAESTKGEGHQEASG